MVTELDPIVIKQLPVGDLVTALGAQDAADFVTFDPRAGQAHFVQGEPGEDGRPGKIRFRLGDTDYPITSDAFQRAGQILGIPAAYIRKTPTRIMLPHVDYWISEGRPDISALTFGYDRESRTIRTFNKGDRTPIPMVPLVEATSEIMATRSGETSDKINANHFYSDERKTMFSLSYPGENALGLAVRKGDVIQTGITIEASYDLLHPTRIASYVQRLVCTNGAVSTDYVYRHSGKSWDGDDDVDWLRESVNEALDGAARELQRINDLQQVRIDGNHLSRTLEGMYLEFGIPVAMRELITQRAIDQEIDTAYDLWNVITDVASNTEEALSRPNDMLSLMRTAASFGAHPSMCDQCHRPLRQ